MRNLPAELKELRFDAASAIAADGWSDLAAAEGDDARLPKFTMTAYTGGIMRPNLTAIPGYGRGVVLDLKGWKFVSGQCPVNYQHNRSDPVGHCEETTIDNQVRASGVLSVPSESTTKIVEAAKNGYSWRPSVEGNPDFDHVERVLDNETVVVNGRRLRGPFLLLRRGEFTGIGFVTTAGDSQARSRVTANFTPIGTESDMNFEEFLAACGVDSETATQDQIATLQAAFDAQYGEPSGDLDPDPKPTKKPAKKQPAPKLDAGDSGNGLSGDDVDPVADENRRLAANRQRVAKITDLCASAERPTIEVDGKEVDLCAHAIETNMEARDVELHILRNSAPRGPAIHSHSGDETRNIEAMSAAVLLASDVPLDSPHYSDAAAYSLGVPANLRAGLNDERRQKLLEAAHRYGDVSLIDLARDAIRLDGKAPPRGRSELIEAAASSGSLHQVYQHTVGASLLVGYREAAGTLERWTSTDEVDDFKQVQRFREDAVETLGYLPPNGEADHLGQSAHFEYLQVDSYAGQREIGEEDYINNNLGLIARTPRNMGEAARRTEENLGYATLLANPTMNSTGRALFNTTDQTLFETHPLTIANASEMIAGMMEQMDGERALDLMAKHCLVPAQLYDTARKIFKSPWIGEDGGEGVLNPVAEYGIQPIAANRLGTGVRHPKTGVFQAGSDEDYYLVAEGVEVAVRVYLRGRSRAPRVRVTPLTQGRWGTHIDVKHIVGFGFLSTKGIFKAEGS